MSKLDVKSMLCQLIKDNTLISSSIAAGVRELAPEGPYRRYEPNGELTLTIELKQEGK